MNNAHWHLLLNHVPVIGLWFSLAWLLAAVLLRNRPMIRVSWITLIACAVVAIPVYLTGEPAEEIVEHLPTVSEPAIEQHEDAAKTALIGIEALGVLALAALALSWKRERLVLPLATGSLVAALIVAGLMSYTANLGGQIRHSEIRQDASSADSSSMPNSLTDENGETHEREGH